MRKGTDTSKINLFDYLDYRRFLKDWTDWAKKARAFSLRAFSQRAGFGSPSFFKLVTDGERNLTEKSLAKFMMGLKLNRQEQEFFRNLVFFNQAKTPKEKDFYYHNLLRSKKFSQLKPIEKDNYEYYSTWYHPVIRELVISKEFDGTPEWLADHVYPPITKLQAEKSVELLEKLGFIQKKGPGRWVQAHALVSTGPEVKSFLVHNYHKQLLDLTKEVLETLPLENRDVSTVTLGIVRERIPQLKREIQEFRQRIIKLVSVDAEPEEVFQLNIQFFPLTHSTAPKQGPIGVSPEPVEGLTKSANHSREEEK
ncbi:MAG: TIGR02147 family protein [Deltaproteobacteria bacterium]|nr:TIGR02147 family protein [Deltaproteobacteria bacterium]